MCFTSLYICVSNLRLRMFDLFVRVDLKFECGSCELSLPVPFSVMYFYLQRNSQRHLKSPTSSKHHISKKKKTRKHSERVRKEVMNIHALATPVQLRHLRLALVTQAPARYSFLLHLVSIDVFVHDRQALLSGKSCSLFQKPHKACPMDHALHCRAP